MPNSSKIYTIGQPGAATYQIIKRVGSKAKRKSIVGRIRSLLPGIIRPCRELPPGSL